ncbi:glycosyltransferase family 4 protein [Patescibacteria group bacterium]
MKIGIDARMYGKAQSGIGNYIQQITAKIFELDKDNDYYIFLLEPVYSQFQPPHNKIHKIKADSPWYSYSEQTKFLQQLLKYKLDLMHFPHFNAPIFYNRSRIHTIHDITPKFFPGHKQKSAWRKFAYNLTLKTGLRKSKKIIASSQATKNDIIKHFNVNPAKIEVILLGTEDHFHVVQNYDKIKEIKAKYKISKPFVFFVSVWRNHKNFEGLIKAFEILKSQYKLDYQLVLGGQADPNYPNINEAIANSAYKEDIITTGFIADKDLPAIYSAAEIFVIPSFYEGFGLIGLEAMACGTPVVSSEVTSLPEIMGEAALYFDPNNHQQMAETINKVLTDQQLKDLLIDKGFNQVKKYSWQKCAQQILKLYQDILQ